ncbi:hypothetical protein EYF80_010261 [Liparis tanakae]|uniref:Uncharacterized protein n=1 Tax=Liparis tanakae TaxID=230148 RepID=A0A4Z2INS9_9TELE|nr:hypothetical protein EYF80_010261 [Liparis tanakae]
MQHGTPADVGTMDMHSKPPGRTQRAVRAHTDRLAAAAKELGHSHGEGGRRVAGQPEPEVRVGGVRVQLLRIATKTMSRNVSLYLFISKLKQRGHGVGAGGEDEDEGGAAVAVNEGRAQIEGRRFDEGTTQTVGNKFLHHGNNLGDA